MSAPEFPVLPQAVFEFLQANYTPNGPKYGTQQNAQWLAGDNGDNELCDVGAAASLWRVSVLGDLLVDVVWGSSRQYQLKDLESPLVGYFPGAVSMRAHPRDPEHGNLVSNVTLTPVAGPGRSNLRRALTFVDVGIDLPRDALYMQAIGLTASVTQRGTATTLDDKAGMVSILHPATLTAGRIFVFFEP